jgi:hypothetical protein
MSSSLIYVHPSKHPNDADLGASVEAALKKQQQPGWHDIYVAVRNGAVTLSGEVTTYRDRQFVVGVTRQAVGLVRIHAKPKAEAEKESSLTDKLRARFRLGKRTDHFKHVPALSESLDDLLVKNTPTHPKN